MGLVYADIQLVNSDDLALVRRGILPDTDIRSVGIRALVDSGASMLVINESIKEQLALPKLGEESAILADGSIVKLDLVGPIEVRFKTRRTTVDALVVPGEAEVLLGAIPLEGMDVIIDPNKGEIALPPERPYIAQTVLKNIF
jgi:clan AA aspartic protease